VTLAIAIAAQEHALITSGYYPDFTKRGVLDGRAKPVRWPAARSR